MGFPISYARVAAITELRHGLNSLKGGYIGYYMGDYDSGY